MRLSLRSREDSIKTLVVVCLFLAAAAVSGQTCVPSSTRLCLSAGRFAAAVSWQDAQGNTGVGTGVSLTADTGYFWFFNDANVELVVKVLDARGLNGHFWVFYGALSNVQYTLTVTDTANGQVKAYTNPLGTFGSVGDTGAFPLSSGASISSVGGQPGATLHLGGRFELSDEASSEMESERGRARTEPEALAAPCTVEATSLFLSACRFRVSATWRDFDGNTGSGQAVTLTADTGYFWFFNAANVELVVKVLDARALNGNFWVFYGALSNVEYEISVTDTATGVVKRYLNPAQHFGSTGDTGAFPPVVAPLPSSEELIDLDLKAGKITDEQALVYRVYVAYGSPSLPAAYQSTVSPGIDMPFTRELPKRFPTLSPAAQAAIRPYLIPPVYAGSWGDPDFASSLASGWPLAESARALPNRTTSACSDGAQAAPLPGWAHKLTDHFNIWYRTVIPPHHTNYPTLAEAERAAINIAAVAEAVRTRLTGLFQKFPLSDANEVCNGGDGLIDVYLDQFGFGALAMTSAYLPGCAERPTWMWIAPGKIQDPKDARDIFAHEFMHMIQFAYSRGSACDDYAWLDEAGGNWAIDFVYPPDQYEQIGERRNYAPCYYGVDYGVPIESSEGRGCNGYSDYVFLFYLSHKLGPETIKHINEYAELYDPFDSLDNATAAAGGLKTVWPDFVTAGWNDWQRGVADDFYKWDQLQEGHKKVSDERDSETTTIDLKGLPEKVFDLSLDFNGTIEPLAARYVYLKFPDANARYVVFHNAPADLASGKPHLHIRALMKINGQWKPEEDWTNAPFKTFCRDARDERIEELVVMYSNSNPARPRESSVIDLIPGGPVNFVPAVQVSNVGCWKWEGTASLTTDNVDGPVTVESAAGVVFQRFRFPGSNPEDTVGYDAFQSANLGIARYSVDGPLLGTSCTIHGTADGLLQGDGEFISDGGFILDFLHPDPRLNRTAIGSGRTNIPVVTETITCSGNTETNTGPKDVRWLSWPEEGASVSADGLHLTGRWERIDDDGHKVSVWDLTAKRE